MIPDSGLHPYDSITPEDLWGLARLKWQRPGVIGAWIAEMDFPLAEPIARTVRRCAEEGRTGYISQAQFAAVHEACARFQLTQFGWHVEPGQVHAIADGLSALEIAIEHYTSPGSPVIVPTPAYMPFLVRPEQLGRQIIRVPMLPDGERMGLDLDAIDAAFAAGAELFVLCNPHNPIGQVYRHDELAALAAVVARRGGRVLADEIHASLVYPGHTHVPYATVSDEAAAHALTLTSAAKTWNIPGLKCAQMILSSAADAEVWAAQGISSRHEPATIGVMANAVAYEEGGEWLSDTLDYLERNRRLLASLMDEILPQVRHRPIEGTYLDWWDLTDLDLPVPAARWLLETACVEVTPGVACGSQSEQTVRFNFAMPAPVLRRTIEQIAMAL